MKQDDELSRLIGAFMDGTLDEAGRQEFERRLREDPEALRQTGEAVRFDMALADVVRPDHLEIVQQRRMVIERSTGKPVIVETSDRVARPIELGTALARKPNGKPKWPLFLVLGGLLAAGGVWWSNRNNGMVTNSNPSPPPAEKWVALPLKNAGFEAPELSGPLTGTEEMPGWQDKFTTPRATVLALPEGATHQGKQVAMLMPGGHMKQLLYQANGSALVFEPGRKLRISGWVKPEGSVPSRSEVFHIALHYVDDRLLQYVVCYKVVPLDGSGWRRISVEMTIPPQEVFEPSYTSATNLLATVTGRPVLLSFTNISSGLRTPVAFMLDDIEVEVMEATASR